MLVGVSSRLLDVCTCDTGVLEPRLGTTDIVEAPVAETIEEKVVGKDDATTGADVAPVLGVSVVSVGKTVGESDVCVPFTAGPDTELEVVVCVDGKIVGTLDGMALADDAEDVEMPLTEVPSGPKVDRLLVCEVTTLVGRLPEIGIDVDSVLGTDELGRLVDISVEAEVGIMIEPTEEDWVGTSETIDVGDRADVGALVAASEVAELKSEVTPPTALLTIEDASLARVVEADVIDATEVAIVPASLATDDKTLEAELRTVVASPAALLITDDASVATEAGPEVREPMSEVIEAMSEVTDPMPEVIELMPEVMGPRSEEAEVATLVTTLAISLVKLAKMLLSVVTGGTIELMTLKIEESALS